MCEYVKFDIDIFILVSYLLKITNFCKFTLFFIAATTKGKTRQYKRYQINFFCKKKKPNENSCIKWH